MADTQLIDPLLLSNFVHQIINPLNGVIGTLDNLIDGTIKDPGRRQQRLEALRAQLTHSVEMIRNLAFLSQLVPGEEDALRQKGQDVVVPKVIIEALQFFQEAGAQRGVRIELTDPITQYRVKGHEDLLRQVFFNLIDNGVKYSEEDSTITITPRPQKKTGHLFVEVESQGSTFDQSEREKIFELGYRSEAARAMRASGTGLGLFICRRIMELAHGATIEAERSAASGRTLFRLRFPAFTVGDPYVRRDTE